MVSILVHSRNALDASSVTPSGRMTVVNAFIPASMPLLITSSFFGSVIVVIPVQPLKIRSPVAVSPAGRTASVNAGHSANA